MARDGGDGGTASLPAPPASHDSTRSARPWVIGGVAVALLGLGLVAVGLFTVRADSNPGYCGRLAAPQPNERNADAYDVVIWFRPFAADLEINEVRDRVQADGRIVQPATYVDQESAYEEFVDLYPEVADDSPVSPQVLPSSLRFDVEDPGSASEVAAAYDGSARAIRAVTVPGDRPPLLFADLLLNTFLASADETPPDIDLTFGPDELQDLDGLEAAPPDDVMEDVTMLADAIRLEAGDDDPTPSATIARTTLRRQAAERILADAADRCGLVQTPVTAPALLS